MAMKKILRGPVLADLQHCDDAHVFVCLVTAMIIVVIIMMTNGVIMVTKL